MPHSDSFPRMEKFRSCRRNFNFGTKLLSQTGETDLEVQSYAFTRGECQSPQKHKIALKDLEGNLAQKEEEIQDFGGRLYMNHILLYRKSLEPLTYHQVTMRIDPFLKTSHVPVPRPNLIEISQTTQSAWFKQIMLLRQDFPTLKRTLIWPWHF